MLTLTTPVFDLSLSVPTKDITFQSLDNQKANILHLRPLSLFAVETHV